MKKIILASASPRRKQLLEQIGLQFEVEPSNYHEDVASGDDSHEIAQRTALEKAKDVASKHKDVLVIAADTFIVFGDQRLGKPHTESEARKMLKRLNGKSHSVITGFSIIDTEKNKTVSRSTETKVYIRKLAPSEIDSYVRSKEPLDKAGAYAIQGQGAAIVEKIEGDYFNVVGLPLSMLAEALKEFGIFVL
jgi:septum formation protein